LVVSKDRQALDILDSRTVYLKYEMRYAS
jgi:hypothetical protein